MKKILMLLGGVLFLFFSLELSYAQMSSSDIEAIQKAIKEKGLSWTVGETDITKMSEAERKARLGSILMPSGSPERPRVGIDTLAKLSMPSYFSWGSNNGHNWMTSVKNQGGCGSCWGFALGGMFEARQRIWLNQPNQIVDVSEQNMVSCWKGNCEGATEPWALVEFATDGTPDEACFPYVSYEYPPYVPPCSDRCSDWQSRAFFVGDWGWRSWPSTEYIKAETQNFGPEISCMDVYTDFDAYTGGVYVHTYGTLEGSHAVVIYGWDDSNNCWLCKNSWGTNWGETGPDGTRGWFRIQMGGANCNHTDEVDWGDPVASGACCLPGGNCVDTLTPYQCIAQHGYYIRGKSCDAVDCPTLTQWGLIILVTLIVVSAWVVMRKRKVIGIRA